MGSKRVAVVKVAEIQRFDIWLIALEPTKGSEIRKTRPCLIVSPNEMNLWLRTVIVAPMTTTIKSYPSRVAIQFGGKYGQVALDQLRCLDRTRLIKRLGTAPNQTGTAVSDVLVEMFGK